MRATRAWCQGCSRDVQTVLDEAGWRCARCERLIKPVAPENTSLDAVARFAAALRADILAGETASGNHAK